MTTVLFHSLLWAFAAAMLQQPLNDQRTRVVDLAPKYKAEKATTYDHRTWLVQRQEVTGGIDQSLTFDLLRRFTVRVVEVREDGGATLEMTFDRIRMTLESPAGGRIEYDSANPPPEGRGGPHARALRRIGGVVATLRLTPDGEPLEVAGLEPIAEATEGNKRLTYLRHQFSEHWFMLTAQDIWWTGGEAERPVGATWTQRDETSVGGWSGAEVATRFTLESVEDNQARITGRGTIDIDFEPQRGLEGADPQITEQTVEYDARWDLNLGRLRRLNSVQSLTVEMEEPDLGFRGVTSLSTKVTMERVDPALLDGD